MRVAATMQLFVVCLCALVLGMCQVIIGQALTPDSERKELGCNVTGEWYSELGSQLQFSVVGPEVRGVYRTAVEIARGAAGPSHEAKVVGVISDGPQPTIAFSVLWAKGSCTTWVGQCFTLPGGGQILRTLWMLRSAAKSSMDDWGSTRLGEDRFTRAQAVESP